MPHLSWSPRRPRPLPLLGLATLLLGTAVAAQPPVPQRAAPRTAVLAGQPGQPIDIQVAPGFLTTLRLDAPLVPHSATVEEQARLEVDEGQKTLTLQLLAPLNPGESRTLRVRYQTGSPGFVTFRLIAGLSEVDTVVTVSRPQQAAEACQAELSSTHERCEAQGRQLAQWEAQLPALGRAALGLTGGVDTAGIRAAVSSQRMKSEKGFVVAARTVLRAPAWAVVTLIDVRNTGPEPWTPTWAEVTPTAGGTPRRARAFFPQHVTFLPGQPASLAIEVELAWGEATAWLTQSCTLTLCDEAGRCLDVPDVKL